MRKLTEAEKHQLQAVRETILRNDKEIKSMRVGLGVYFPHAAYAGVFRRFLILAIDLTVLILLGCVLALVCSVVFDGRGGAAFVCAWLILSYTYLVPLEARIGTFGFFLTGTRIVDLNGNRPSLRCMTFRLLLCVWWLRFLPFLVDLVWSAGDDCKQTLRDKFANTYVVRKSAAPAGQGTVRLVYYFLFGFAVAFAEVQMSRKIGHV